MRLPPLHTAPWTNPLLGNRSRPQCGWISAPCPPVTHLIQSQPPYGSPQHDSRSPPNAPTTPHGGSPPPPPAHVVSEAAAKQQPMETQATPSHTQQSACAPADPSALRGEHQRTPRTSRVQCVTPAAALSDGVQRTSYTSQQLRGRAEGADVPGATPYSDAERSWRLKGLLKH